MSEDKAVLHYVRLRSKDEPDFYDPQADIRRLLMPAATNAAMQLLHEHKDEPAPWEHIIKCLQVLSIHLDEDPAPLGDQLREFF